MFTCFHSNLCSLLLVFVCDQTKLHSPAYYVGYVTCYYVHSLIYNYVLQHHNTTTMLAKQATYSYSEVAILLLFAYLCFLGLDTHFLCITISLQDHQAFSSHLYQEVGFLWLWSAPLSLLYHEISLVYY